MTRAEADGGGGRSAGSAADEAARLLAAAERWARTRGSALIGDPQLAPGAPECTACPICSAVGALRQVRPETAQHLLDAAGSLVAALRTAFPAPAPAPAPGGRVERIDLEEPPAPPVERIDVERRQDADE